MVTGLLPFSAAFSAFSSEIPWLIALAFFLARGFIKTGLGNRIAYMIVSAFNGGECQRKEGPVDGKPHG